MNLKKYTANDENLYGLTILNLNMKVDYGSELEKFTIGVKSPDDMKLMFEKYNMDFERVYITALVHIKSEEKMDQFYETGSPYYKRVLDVWVYREFLI